jgi:ferredoxin--NADP+ reductase
MSLQHEPTVSAKPFSVQRVLEIKYWTPTLLSFTVTRPAAFQFAAGQYARIALPSNEGMIWRAYSMVSAPQENHLEFIGVLIPEGFFSSKLGELRADDAIWIEMENYGFMTPDRFVDGEDLWMLATGTGLGPFMSILRDQVVWRQFKQLILVHSVRQEAELAYQSELMGMQAAALTSNGLAGLHLIQCVTQNQAVTAIPVVPRLTQRITSALVSGELEVAAQRSIDAKISRVMMCGNPQMIEDTRKLLHKRGLKPCRRVLGGEFLAENYW